MLKKMALDPWRRNVGVGCLAAAFVVATGCGVSYAVENAAGADREPEAVVEYESNGAGQAFGTCVDASTYDEMPDLVLVVATNGKEGYVHREALEEAEGGSIEQPEALLRRTQEQQRAFSEAFAASLEESGHRTNREAVDEFIEEARFGEGVEDATADLAEKLESGYGEGAASANAGGASEAEVVKRDVEEALAEALRASGTVLPVYDVDGTTVIGEFLVAGAIE